MTLPIDIEKRLSNTLANKCGDAQISTIAKSLRSNNKPVIGFDPCIYGICINYGIDGRISALNLEDWKVGGLGSIQEADIMIDGIKLPERTTLRIKYNH